MHLKVATDVFYTSKFNTYETLDPLIEQSGYFMFGANATLQGPDDRWSVALIGRNLTNQITRQYFSSLPLAASSVPGQGSREFGCFANRPYEFWFQGTYHFH